MVDDDRLRWHEERVQPLRNLGELHPLRLKDLQDGREKEKKERKKSHLKKSQRWRQDI